jgi:hypothetical protein
LHQRRSDGCDPARDVEILGLINHAASSDELTGLEAAVVAANESVMDIVAGAK